MSNKATRAVDCDFDLLALALILPKEISLLIGIERNLKHILAVHREVVHDGNPPTRPEWVPST